MFNQVDKTFKDVMRKTNKIPLAIKAGTQPGLLQKNPNIKMKFSIFSLKVIWNYFKRIMLYSIKFNMH
jgi:hypothetical protein